MKWILLILGLIVSFGVGFAISFFTMVKTGKHYYKNSNLSTNLMLQAMSQLGGGRLSKKKRRKIYRIMHKK